MTLLLLLGATGDELDLFYQPIRQDVARLLRSRTTGSGGELQEFTAETNPTHDEVDLLIDDAASLVAARVGLSVPESLWPIAKRAVTIQTAMLIEVGSEEFVAERYDRLAAMLEALLLALIAALAALENEDPDSLLHGAPIGLAPGMTGRWGVLDLD